MPSIIVQLPVLTELRVINYELFPGDPPGNGIAWTFEPGVTVIAGINGLGKTTILMMILRSLSGPYDLTGDGGSSSLNVVLPEKPVRLTPRHRHVFRPRVSDEAEHAKVTLSARIGDSAVAISRGLGDLVLERLTVNEMPIELPNGVWDREQVFQSTMTELMGLGSFVDVLLVLHHVILYYERRPEALWDTNAQRQLLRALCLGKANALRVAELERELQSADSRARNIHARMTSAQERWEAALKTEAKAEGVFAELSAEQRLLDAELLEAERLEKVLQEADAERKAVRLAYERAKIAREDADRAIERVKYGVLLNHFPNMDETMRFALSRIMADGRCLVCNSPAAEKQEELDQQVAHGCCPVCGAEPDIQDNIIVSQQTFDQAKLSRERARAEQAKREEHAQSERLGVSLAGYESTLGQMIEVRASIKERTRRNDELRGRLPDTVTSREYENELNALRREHREWEAVRATRLHQLRSLFVERQDEITAKSSDLVGAFESLIRILLVEEVRLVPVSAQPRYMEAPGEVADRVRVPAYQAEMTSAARPDYVPRNDPSTVSESQRELIDLAFRLALVQVFGGSCTFLMETPEASLDGVAMGRVARALAAFAGRADNRLVVTSNLTNAGVITALFDSSGISTDSVERVRRVLNLLKVAAPNRALLEDRKHYEELLQEAVFGTGRQ